MRVKLASQATKQNTFAKLTKLTEKNKYENNQVG